MFIYLWTLYDSQRKGIHAAGGKEGGGGVTLREMRHVEGVGVAYSPTERAQLELLFLLQRQGCWLVLQDGC